MFPSAVAFLAVVTHGCVTVNVKIQDVLVVVVYDPSRIVHEALVKCFLIQERRSVQ